MDGDRLAVREVVQPLLRKMYRILDDIDGDRIEVRDKLYASNSLHLLRDAVLDAEGIASLFLASAARRVDLERRQIESMTFHGALHDEYHDASRQVRASVGAGIAQTKRILNQTADLVDAFVAHGTRLRSKSFGSQVASLSDVPDRAFEPRTEALLTLLRSRGEDLDRTTHFRDKFLEHVHPSRRQKQPRPISGVTGLGFVAEPEFELPITDVVESDFNWVKFDDQKGTAHSTYVITHSVLAGSRPGQIEVVRLDFERLGGHFRSNDPHHHLFRFEESPRISLEAEGEADLAEVQSQVLTYVADLLTIVAPP